MLHVWKLPRKNCKSDDADTRDRGRRLYILPYVGAGMVADTRHMGTGHDTQRNAVPTRSLPAGVAGALWALCPSTIGGGAVASPKMSNASCLAAGATPSAGEEASSVWGTSETVRGFIPSS